LGGPRNNGLSRVLGPFAQFPQLQLAGGSVAGRPGAAPRAVGVLVVSLGGGGYSAVNAICTHLGCTVGYDGSRGVIVCPCHDSRFATDGAVIQGPATRSLERFDVVADAAGVTVRVPA
jgi:Rieske Fe-S protein